VRVCLDGDEWLWGGDIRLVVSDDDALDRGEYRMGDDDRLSVGELGARVGDIALRETSGAGAEKVGVTKGDTGAEENAGKMCSAASGRGCTEAGH
jgi:hypothetical protein